MLIRGFSSQTFPVPSQASALRSSILKEIFLLPARRLALPSQLVEMELLTGCSLAHFLNRKSPLIARKIPDHPESSRLDPRGLDLNSV